VVDAREDFADFAAWIGLQPGPKSSANERSKTLGFVRPDEALSMMKSRTGKITTFDRACPATLAVAHVVLERPIVAQTKLRARIHTLIFACVGSESL
jgi:hypothetical protein